MESRVFNRNGMIGRFLFDSWDAPFDSWKLEQWNDYYDHLTICDISTTLVKHVLSTFVFFGIGLSIALGSVFALGVWIEKWFFNGTVLDLISTYVANDQLSFPALLFMLGHSPIVLGSIALFFVTVEHLDSVKRKHTKVKHESFVKAWWESKRDKICFKVQFK